MPDQTSTEQTTTPDPELVAALADAEVARVRAGHGLDTPPRPGGLLGPLPRRTRDEEPTDD